MICIIVLVSYLIIATILISWTILLESESYALVDVAQCIRILYLRTESSSIIITQKLFQYNLFHVYTAVKF